jgi:hypothetical protein
LTRGRRRLAGTSGTKGFLRWTVLLGRADRVGRNQIKSFLNFGIWQDYENLHKEI